MLIPLVLAVLYFGSPYFELLIGLAIIIASVEVFLATNRHLIWSFSGTLYITVSGLALIELRGDTVLGLATVTWLFMVVWSSDIGAYIVGKILGGAKFAPRISPKKTWSGFCGAIVFACLSGSATGYLMNTQALWALAIFSGVIGAISQFGDLLESWVKRRFDKKDMSNLIPGHGGLSDRIDGLAAASIFVWALDKVKAGPLIG